MRTKWFVLLTILILLGNLTSMDYTEANTFRGNLHRSGVYDSTVPENNSLLWSFETGDPIESSVAVADNRVYFGSENGKVYCLDAFTGDDIWNFSTNNEVDSTPAVVDGVVYVGSADKRLYAIDAETGDELWNHSLSSPLAPILSSPAVTHDKIFFGSQDRNLYAINATTHELEWSFPTGNDIWSSPAVDWPYVYIGSVDGKVYCVWANNGTQKWAFDTNVEPSYDYEIYSTPVIANGSLYIGACEYNTAGEIFKINASTGEKIWSFFPPGLSRTSEVYSSAAVHDGRVFIHTWRKDTGGGFLYALPEIDPNASGFIEQDEIIWAFQTYDFEGGSSPAVADGKVLVGSTNGRLYCVNETNGEELWNLTTGGDIVSSPTVDNGVVYICSRDGSIYAVGGTGSADLEIQIIPEFPSIKSNRIMGITFLVTYGDEPIEGAFITVEVSEGDLSQQGASTFPDGTQRIKYTAPEVKENLTVTIHASVTKFGYPEGESSVQFIVEPSSSYGKVGSSSMFSLSKYWPYIAAIVALIAFNAVIIFYRVRKGKGKENKVENESEKEEVLE